MGSLLTEVPLYSFAKEGPAPRTSSCCTMICTMVLLGLHLIIVHDYFSTDLSRAILYWYLYQ